MGREDEKARDHLNRALLMFEEMGMRSWEERTRKVLDSLCK